MRASTALFGQAIAGPHRLAVDCRARFGTGLWEPLPISDGTVTFDRTRLVRGTVDLTVPGREWSLLAANRGWPLSPYGGEVMIGRGIRWDDFNTEIIQLGIFVIQRALPSGRDVKIAGFDRYSRLVDDRFEQPRMPASNSSTVAVITSLIQETIPGVTVTVSPNVVDRAYLGRSSWDEDRAKAVADLATSLGCDVYANADGGFTIRPTPALTDAPVLKLGGADGAPLIEATGEQSRDRVYNAVVARSEPADPDTPIIRVVVRDLNPASPTYYWGPFGKKPRFYVSPLLGTTDQATTAAKAILMDSIGARRPIDFATIPDPRLETGDVLQVTPEGLETVESHIIDQLSVPLTAAGAMSGATRSAPDPEGVS